MTDPLDAARAAITGPRTHMWRPEELEQLAGLEPGELRRTAEALLGAPPHDPERQAAVDDFLATLTDKGLEVIVALRHLDDPPLGRRPAPSCKPSANGHCRISPHGGA